MFAKISLHGDRENIAGMQSANAAFWNKQAAGQAGVNETILKRQAAVRSKYGELLKDLGLSAAEIAKCIMHFKVGFSRTGDAQVSLLTDRESIASMQSANSAVWNKVIR